VPEVIEAALRDRIFQGRRKAALLQVRQINRPADATGGATAVLDDDTSPAAARPWLEEFVEHLRERVERWLVSEANEEMDLCMSGGVQDAETPDRLFAARRLLEMGKLDRVLQLLSREELLQLLPKLRLSDTEQQLIRNEMERT
jgi:hypothetical protein